MKDYGKRLKTMLETTKMIIVDTRSSREEECDLQLLGRKHLGYWATKKGAKATVNINERKKNYRHFFCASVVDNLKSLSRMRQQSACVCSNARVYMHAISTRTNIRRKLGWTKGERSFFEW